MSNLTDSDMPSQAQDSTFPYAERSINSEGEILAGAPLLLGLQLCNQNNNNNATLVPQRYIAEAVYLKGEDGAELGGLEKTCDAAEVPPTVASKLLCDQIQGSDNNRSKIAEDGPSEASIAVQRPHPEVNHLEKGIDPYCKNHPVFV